MGKQEKQDVVSHYLPSITLLAGGTESQGGDINEFYSYVTMKDNLLNKGAYLKWSKNKLYS